MRKELPIGMAIAIGLLELNSSAPIPAQAQEPKPTDSTTFIPISIPTPEFTPFIPTETPTKVPSATATPTETEIPEFPIAENCIMPFTGAFITQGFNEPILYKSGLPVEDNGHPIRHLGIDFAPLNSVDNSHIPVSSICDGEFVASTNITYDTGRSLGNIVVIKYFDGSHYFYAIYAHLGQILTENHKPGDLLQKGEIIGTLGNSGGWVNKHLHLQIWREKAWNRFVMQEGKGNLGLYPETWNEKLVNENFVDPLSLLDFK